MKTYFCLIDMVKYGNELVPAFHDFVERSERDKLKTLIREAIATVDIPDPRRPGFAELPAAVYEEFESILEDAEYYNRSGIARESEDQKTSDEDMLFFVTNILLPSLLALLGVASGSNLNPWQDVSGGDLTTVLYAQSRWIEQRLTFAVEMQGKEPEITIGEWSRFLTNEEEEQYKKELSNVPVALEAGTLSAYLNLQAIFQQATRTDETRVLACIV